MNFAMRRVLAGFAAIAISAAVFGQEDAQGSKDYPGVTRMPGYYIADYQESQFDSFTFKVKDGNGSKEQAEEGHRFDFRYNLKDGSAMPSQLQIHRNFQNAAKAVGGQVIYASDDTSTLRIIRNGKETWINVENGNIPSGMFITLNIIEKEAMKQDVAMNADAMAKGLSDTGQVAIYGIYFDTAKAELKAESEPALAEIAKLMGAHPELKVYVVGHTDMVGDAGANLKLSQARAQSVVTALVAKNGIANARLIPYGAGSYAPVATNKTEEGRAKNRRVELVEIATK